MSSIKAYPIQRVKNDTNILSQTLHNGTHVLIDLTWSAQALAVDKAMTSFPLRVSGNTITLSVDVLLSTPSDLAKILNSPNYGSANETANDTIRSVLRRMSMLQEPVLRTVLDFLRSGRFNSSTHSGECYSIDHSTSILVAAVEFGFSRVVDCCVVEMHKYFETCNKGIKGVNAPIELSYAQLYRLCMINDDRVYRWVVAWVVCVFRYGKGERDATKEMVEKVVKDRTVLGDIVGWWFETKEGGSGKVDGEGEGRQEGPEGEEDADGAVETTLEVGEMERLRKLILRR